MLFVSSCPQGNHIPMSLSKQAGMAKDAKASLSTPLLLLPLCTIPPLSPVANLQPFI
jgi:hypothetical protein